MTRSWSSLALGLALLVALATPVALATDPAPGYDAPPARACTTVDDCWTVVVDTSDWGWDAVVDTSDWGWHVTVALWNCSWAAVVDDCEEAVALGSGEALAYVYLRSETARVQVWEETNGCEGLQRWATSCGGPILPADRRVA